ncbi:hypothetical protein [Nocardia sp. NBC_01388]|uniref:hypothetical protein n=1 Tax=Nocardia sp. NBC_01388 TaxID=2903596 RepID=UPI00324697DC
MTRTIRTTLIGIAVAAAVSAGSPLAFAATAAAPVAAPSDADSGSSTGSVGINLLADVLRQLQPGCFTGSAVKTPPAGC